MKYKPDICHVRDCVAGPTHAESQIFPVAGDMRYLPVVLSSVARKFRNKKSNYICKAHFLPEDMPLTRSGIMLSKRAVPCLQVPRKTLKMVIRSGISPKHSEVAGALLERARVVQAERDSSSDSDTPSEPMAASVASQSPTANPAFGYSYVDSSLGSLQGSEISATQTYVPEATALTLQQRLQLAGKPSIKRFAEKYISRHDSGFVDYKRLKISDSESPQSQAEGDAASETSNGNSRPVEDVDEEDEITDVTDVGVVASRDDGDVVMDEDDDDTENHTKSHGRVRSHVKVITPRIRSVGAAAKPRHHNHNHQHNHHHHYHNPGGRRHREEDEDDDDDEHHRSGETVEEDDDEEEDDESLDEKNEHTGKRPRDPDDDEDDGDDGDDDEARSFEKLKKFRRNDDPLTAKAQNDDEDDEDFEDQLHHRRRRRPRHPQDRGNRAENAEEDGDDEEEQDYDVDEDEEDEFADGGDEDEPEDDVIPSPRKVQSRAAPRDAA